MARSAIAFALSFLVVGLMASSLDIYYFDNYEPAWGPASSMQVAIWAFGGLSVLAFLLHLLGQVLSKQSFLARLVLQITLGVAFALGMFITDWLLEKGSGDREPIPELIGWLYLIGVPLAVGFFSRRRIPAPSNF